MRFSLANIFFQPKMLGLQKTVTPTHVHVAIFCSLCLLMSGLSFKNYHAIQLGVSGDDAVYAILAHSLVFSEQYGLNYAPGEPLPPRHPFGFPLILSLIARFFPEAPEALKLVSFAATLSNMALLFWGWRFLLPGLSYWWCLAALALYALSPISLDLTRSVMSEPIFTTFALLSMIFAQKMLHDTQPHPVGLLVLGGVAMFTAAIRTIGITLLAAIILSVAWRSTAKWKNLSMLASGGALFLLLVVSGTSISFSTLFPREYVDQLQRPAAVGQTHIEANFLVRGLTAYWEYVSQHIRFAVACLGGGEGERAFGQRFGVPNLPLLTGLLIGISVMIGWGYLFARRMLSFPAALFCLLYFGVILLWPWREPRFLYPIQPLLCAFFLCGIQITGTTLFRAFCSLTRSRVYGNAFAAFACLTILAVFIFRGVTDVSNSFASMPRDFRIGTLWLKEHAPQDAVIMAQNPETIFWYSQRKTINYLDVSTEDALNAAINTHHIDYLLIAPKKEWRTDGGLEYDDYTKNVLLPIIKNMEANGEARLVFQSMQDSVGVYRVITSKTQTEIVEAR